MLLRAVFCCSVRQTRRKLDDEEEGGLDGSLDTGRGERERELGLGGLLPRWLGFFVVVLLCVLITR
jgi:hypothetical protein